MEDLIMPFGIIAGVLLLLGLVFAFFSTRTGLGKSEDEKHPEGHFQSMGIAMGIPLGMPIGLAMGNIAFGIPIGLAFGVAIGAYLEKKNKDKMRPMTKQEKEDKSKLLMFSGGILLLALIGVIILLVL